MEGLGGSWSTEGGLELPYSPGMAAGARMAATAGSARLGGAGTPGAASELA